FTLFFIFNLSLGLCGFIAINSYRLSIEKALSDHSKSVLGADLGVSARHPIEKETLKIVLDTLPQKALKSEVMEL
ncbi:MAG: hypothetical protein KDD35_06160, partial [Bdellovibrionales bacterium]|nr:hypothetical protein [Bdellovibrionales bacterium]